METTIDKAGRVIVPKQVRDELGFVPGKVQLVIEGSGVRIEPLSPSGYTKKGRFLVVEGGQPIDDETVHKLRMMDQR